MMKEPDIVAKSIEEMSNSVNIPVTVKCRIGIDEFDSFEFLNDFVSKVSQSGCKTFVIHARKCWLKGLSPKENRTVPPIDYERIAKIKAAHPELNIIVNGDIKTVDNVKAHLKKFDSAMIGREAYQNPYLLAELEQSIFNNDKIKSREEIALEMIPYIEKQMKDYGTPVKSITRHIIGLFHEQKGAKKWRQTLSTLPHEEGANANVIKEALRFIG